MHTLKRPNIMFSVGFGIKNREKRIREMAKSDRCTAVILAAVHFEWMLKRALLKLGTSPTSELRQVLESVYSMAGKNGQQGYSDVWASEIGSKFKHAALGTVIGKLQRIQAQALNVRGKVIHGNGTVSKKDADEAIELFLGAGEKLRNFAANNGCNLDSKLRTRRKPRRKP